METTRTDDQPPQADAATPSGKSAPRKARKVAKKPVKKTRQRAGHTETQKERREVSEANNVNIKEMTLVELKELQAKVEKELPGKAKQAARDAAQQVKRIMSDYNVTFEQLEQELRKPAAGARKKVARKKVSARRTTAKVAPKYRHPDDSKLTWAGRGRKPKWLEAELAAGRSIDDFAI